MIVKFIFNFIKIFLLYKNPTIFKFVKNSFFYLSLFHILNTPALSVMYTAKASFYLSDSGLF